jgi:uncharacterized membrane protein
MGAWKGCGCAAAVLVLLEIQSAIAAQYSVIDLGILPSFNSSSPSYLSMGEGIDDANQAAGDSNIYVNNVGVTHGFFWDSGSLSDLSSPSSSANFFVHGMGPSGQVVGENGTGSAFVWTKTAGFTNLTNLGGTTGAAFGMNSLGDVVGTDTEGSLVYGVVWKSGGNPITLSPVNSMFFASGQAINASRTIAGFSFGPSSDVATIWVYDTGTGNWVGQSLGTLGGTGSDAYAVNTAGDVVGNAERAGGHGIGAFIWHPSDTSLTDLDPTEAFGLNTFAKGINDNNEVVGSIAGGGAFVWTSTSGIRDLQTLIDPASPFSFTDATDVNNNGWIVGTATDSSDHFSHAVLLEPTPQFLPGDFNLDGHVDAADISAALKALTNLSQYQSDHSLSAGDLETVGDVNGDGKITNADIQALIHTLQSGGGSVIAVPEPSAWLLLWLGVVGFLALFRWSKFCRTWLMPFLVYKPVASG